jgi:phage terminase large subunit-like protein
MGDAWRLLGGLVVEAGCTWAEQVTDWQRADAEAICAATGPRRHFLVRPRGASKTSDAAAVALALLVEEAPPRSRSYIYAVDQGQASELFHELAGFVSRTPGLSGAVAVGATTVTARATGRAVDRREQ